jgi:glycerophosphoryl diester phosphodiesterase
VYAHRFGSRYGPESSRAALEASLTRKVDGLEADVILSGDDEVFALHDPDLSLSTDATGWAQDRPADEIDAAHIRDQRGDVSDETPLRLGQVLDVIPPDLPLQLDVKAYADHDLARRTTRRACEIAQEHGTQDRIEIISFFTGGCEIAREHDIKARLVLWADYDPKALVRWLAERNITGVSLEGFILSPDLVDPLHGAEVTLSVGAVNSRLQVERLLPMRPDILVSDRPSELKDELHQFETAVPLDESA